MEPNAATPTEVQTPTLEAGSPTRSSLEDAEPPETAPSGTRTPNPPIPPVAVDTGDGNDGENQPAFGGISRRIYLGVSAETVWPWLFDPELVRRYHLADLIAQPEGVGDLVQFRHRLAGHLLIDGEVLEWVEGRRLVYSYSFLREEPEPPSRVTVELLRYGDRMCCLELHHDELLIGGETWQEIEVFWDKALSSLKTWLETGHPLPWPGRQSH